MLEKRKYSAIDILGLTYKCTPAFTILFILLTTIDAVIPTVLMALSTAHFVDTAMNVLAGHALYFNIFIPLAGLIAVIGAANVIDSLQLIIESRIRLSLDRNLLPAILEVQAKLKYNYIEDAHSRELIEITSYEMNETFWDGLQAYAAVIRSVIGIGSIIMLVVTQMWWAAILIAAFCVPLFFVSIWAGKKNYSAKVETRKYERRYSYYSDEVLCSREAVYERTLFRYADDVTNRYYESFKLASRIQLKVLFKTRITTKTTSILLLTITMLTALTLIEPVLDGVVSPGMFMGIVAALMGMAKTLGWQLQDAAKNIAEAQEYMGGLTALLKFESVEGATDLPDKVPLAFKDLEFRNVRFKYPNGDNYILDGISFKIEHGKHYAFVGVNGAGKSTITKLLTGLYDEYEGEILINGKELRFYPAAALKALFSVIYQDFSHYQISLLDNIAIGDISHETDDSRILQAALEVGLGETVNKIKDGIKTQLGKIDADGIDISGGQWQKIAIARSVISAAPIKILDEPTASLDPISENKLYKQFKEIMVRIMKNAKMFFSIILRNSMQYFMKAKGGGIAEQTTAILRALLWTAGLIATQRLFDAVTEPARSGNDFRRIAICLGALTVIVIAQQAASGIGQYLLSKVSYTNMGKFMAEFQRKLGRLPAVYFEDVNFLNKIDKAKECLEYESLGHFASICLQLVTYYLVYFLSIGGYLFILSPLL